jgi:hypothetical protein
MAEAKDIEMAQRLIAEECDNIKKMLLEKNKSYGNSSLEPIGIFASSDPIPNINSRIDDKLSRIARGHAFTGEGENEDMEVAERDIVGYLIIKRVARRFKKDKNFEVIVSDEFKGNMK